MVECIYTINCKMAPTQEQVSEIEATLIAFADACTWINDSVDARIRNRVTIHHFAYKDVRAKFGLSSNLAVNAVARVAGNRKTAHLNGSNDYRPGGFDGHQRRSQPESRKRPTKKGQWLGVLPAKRVLDLQGSCGWNSTGARRAWLYQQSLP